MKSSFHLDIRRTILKLERHPGNKVVRVNMQGTVQKRFSKKIRTFQIRIILSNKPQRDPDWRKKKKSMSMCLGHVHCGYYTHENSETVGH